jgi:EAL domain-containing protein (putative c-di-GMP-specific phosphodiesterase class I)
MKPIAGTECRGPCQAIVRAVSQICSHLGIDIIAEGIETEDEYAWLASQGKRLFQWYLKAWLRVVPASPLPETLSEPLPLFPRRNQRRKPVRYRDYPAVGARRYSSGLWSQFARQRSRRSEC